MTPRTFSAQSGRVAKARLARRAQVLVRTSAVALACLGAAIILAAFVSIGASLLAGGLFASLLTIYLWLKYDVLLLEARPFAASRDLAETLPAELVGQFSLQASVAGLWQLLDGQFETRFLVARFGLHPELIAAGLETASVTLDDIISAAENQATAAGLNRLTVAAVTAGLLVATPNLRPLLTAAKLEPETLSEGVGWLARLHDYRTAPKPLYGGLGRDWAVGYTPLLARYGQNYSRAIELGGQSFGQLPRDRQLAELEAILNSSSPSAAIIGDNGIGKTALLSGLAERLLAGRGSRELAHYQIIGLNASNIITNASQPGDIERIVMALLNEAAHAGNVVVALDEAQLFFGQGTGAVNLSQVLLPVLQGRRLKLILTIGSGDWQHLRTSSAALTGLVTPLVLTPPSEAQTIRLAQDRALILEQGRYTTSYQALREAYRLSERYYPDDAQPGKTIRLIEASYAQASGGYVGPEAVQAAVESQLGVKVGAAAAEETDVLLHLEDRIHERMINQTRAVEVVAAALRRARAGVASPKRPVGSFLFLGPTGVGKTELARSLSALYFGSEQSMVRLDMSEYGQPTDVARLLAGPDTNPQGLLTRVRTNPFTVVLLDEIEKADGAILNLMLQMLDEGTLSDTQGRPTSFKDAIIIATSNAGADEIRHRIEAGQELPEFEQTLTDQLIASGQFRPELLNRFDEIVLFRPLTPAELLQVVGLMIAEVNRTLEPQRIRVTLTEAAAKFLVATGYDPRLGARPMRRMVTRTVEDAVAARILGGTAATGDTIALSRGDVGGASETETVAAPGAPDQTAVDHSSGAPAHASVTPEDTARAERPTRDTEAPVHQAADTTARHPQDNDTPVAPVKPADNELPKPARVEPTGLNVKASPLEPSMQQAASASVHAPMSHTGPSAFDLHPRTTIAPLQPAKPKPPALKLDAPLNRDATALHSRMTLGQSAHPKRTENASTSAQPVDRRGTLAAGEDTHLR